MLVLLFSLIYLIGLGTSSFNEVELSKLARELAEDQYIACLSVLYPKASKSSPEVFRLTKELQNGYYLHTVRAKPFDQPGTLFDWRGCARVLYVMLGWLPNAEVEFAQFTISSLTNDPIWLVILDKEKKAIDFIGDTYLPYPARLLLAKKSEGSFSIEEAWQASMGYATHVVPFASWSFEKGFICHFRQCSFHPRKDLEGAPFRASTKDDMPISEITHHPVDHSLFIGGYFGDIFYELASQLNATTVIIPATENATGSAWSNGSWMGLIGMMQRNETDFGVGPLSIQFRVLEVIDFVKPLLRTNFQVFFKQDGTVVEWDAYITPFGKFVWRLIFLWFFIGAFTLNFFYRVGIRYGQENRAYAGEFSKINSFLTFFKAFCQQGSHLMPHSLSCRGLYLTGYLTSTILVTAYSAALISKLTLQEPLRPFDSLETFLEDGSYTLTAIVASTDYTYFSEASDQTLKSIYKRMMEYVPTDQLPVGKEEGLIQVCEKNKWALFITFAVTQIAAKEFAFSRKCPILYFRNPLGTVFLTIGIRKQMPYSRLIGIQLQTMSERGLLNRLRTKEWPLKSYSGLKILTPQVEIQQVVQIHCLLIIGMTISVLILALEKASVSPKALTTLNWIQKQYGINVENATTALFLVATATVIITVIIGFA